MAKVALIEEDLALSDKVKLSAKIDTKYIDNQYLNVTTKELIDGISSEASDSIVYTKDSRVLLGIGDKFLLSDIYIYRKDVKELVSLKDSTIYHIDMKTDIFRLYELGEFHKYRIKDLRVKSKIISPI